MQTAASPTVTCSEFALALGEAQYGNFKPAHTWLLLEYDGRWEPEAIPDSALPAPVKEHLGAFLAAHPQSRALLIRQQPRLVRGGPRFFVVRATPPYRQHGFALSRYEDLLDLDLDAIAAGDRAFDTALHSDPLLLVCTHGRRDRCCARHGVPVYERLAALAGAGVWQSSHVGGHRFAANVLIFPQGLVYGRVSADTATALYDAYQRGELLLDHYRARVAYPQPAQAAECYLRQRTDQMALTAFDLEAVEQGPDGVWAVSFGARDGARLTVTVREQAGPLTLSSCGDPQLSPSLHYALVNIT
ncbi:MAG: sucrase ferredoxin [Anaerolineae bacterium]